MARDHPVGSWLGDVSACDADWRNWVHLHLPERGDNVIEWSSESDVSEAAEPKARSRSPAASPSSSLLVVRILGNRT